MSYTIFGFSGDTFNRAVSSHSSKFRKMLANLEKQKNISTLMNVEWSSIRVDN